MLIIGTLVSIKGYYTIIQTLREGKKLTYLVEFKDGQAYFEESQLCKAPEDEQEPLERDGKDILKSEAESE